MRISMNKNDRGFTKEGEFYSIYLNNKEITGVITADEEEKYIIAYCKKPNGDYIIEKDYIKTEKLFGRVKIIDNRG